MSGYAVDIQEVDRADISIVGGKGAHLGELSRIGSIQVPAGFCVTTGAFQRIMAEAPSMHARLDKLSQPKPDDHNAIRSLSLEIRQTLEAIVIPSDVATAIADALAQLGEHVAYAVRSSATAEDLPTASFAGQQDTYLNIVGTAAILRHVSLCWASLFTERAVTYRLRNGFDHGKVLMAVVVQRMVFPDTAGILFTADPITGNRKVSSIDASFGLGEALVSGIVNADVFKVRDGVVVERAIATKKLAILASRAGGTEQQVIGPGRQQEPALTDAQAIRLAAIGRVVEAHFGQPQDIEWCLAGDEIYVVQSRPITTLFPIPETADGENHVYVSVGHQQMMTDPMKPLGLSVWQLTTPAGMAEAGGRLFVDVTRPLASPASRALQGPLHGGAPGPVLDLIAEAVPEKDKRAFLRSKVEDGERLMGFGHRIYRVRDPRADVLAKACETLRGAGDQTPLFDTAREVERLALKVLEEHKPGRALRTNVEFYTALLLHAVGIPKEIFTAVFATSRVAGWIAHAHEQLATKKLVRPQSNYVGPRGRALTAA
ncbi:MAG: PEP/pyruvate-binding domain-containing protein [Gemmatimonadaceae bacterium]